MHELAVGIVNALDNLVDEYAGRLRSISGYAEMSDQARLEMARNALLLVAAGLEASDPSLFVQFVRAIATERAAQGFDIEAVQQALTVLAELLESRAPSVEAANLLWRTMVQVHLMLSQLAMARMRATEEQFEYLGDNIAVGVFIHREGILRYAGREGARLLGYDDPDELINRSVFDFVHPDDRERVANIARARVAGKPVPDQYEARLLRRDGSSIDVQLFSRLTEYEGQVATQGIFVDISERKREEERIRQAQRSLQMLVDSMPFGVMIMGTDRRIRQANRSALAAMGYETEEEVLGLVCHETMCPAEAEHCPILDLGQDLDRSERILMTKDGRQIPILKSAIPVTLDGEEVLLEAFIDITEQKRLERQIQGSLERRGWQVQTSTEVAQEIATAPMLHELYQKVVTLVKERFGYYHAQLFLLDDEGDRFVTVSGYGEAGQQMVQQGHFIPVGNGVVGRAGASGRTVLSPDVSQDPEWLYHPLLPETKGEMAVPIVLRQAPLDGGRDGPEGEFRDRVLGVLDVQSDEVHALTDDDRIVLEGLCGQIAVAIESTRLRQETEDYLHELERLTHALSREGWDALRYRAGSIGYLFDQHDVVPTDSFWAPEVGEAARREAFTLPISDRHPLAVAPLKAPGGAFMGVLGVEDDPQAPMSQEDLALIEAVSEQVAAALESARLFEETRRRAREQGMLFDVSQALAAAPVQAEEIADIVARQFVAVMEVPEASVSLLEVGSDALRTVADVYADPAEARVRDVEEDDVFSLVDYPATGHVMETLQPLVVHASDPDADPGELAYMQRHGTETLVIIPLAVKGQAIGVAELEVWDGERQFTSDELNLASTLANQAAVALENARLLAESQVRAEEQAILNEVGQALAACQDVDSVLDETYRGVSRLMDTTYFYIMLYDPDASETTLAMAVDDGQVEKPRTIQPVEELGLTERLITTRQPLLIPDRVQERVAEMGLRVTPISAGRLWECWLGVPILIGDRVLGTMVVLSYTTPRVYDRRGRDLLNAVANQTAIALENVRLLERTQAALAEVQATHRAYLRRAWQDHLQERKTLERSGFVYDRHEATDPGGAVAEPDLWRPEMERAVAKRGPAVVRSGDGDEERAGLAVPITLRGQTLGVIGVEAPAGRRQWTDDEIALIAAVGEQLGQALESARLFADTQRSAERERLVGEITSKIRASTDVQAILETAAEELSHVLGTSRALVRLTTGETKSGRQDRPAEPARPAEDTPDQVDEQQGVEE